jgi:hypothetical protein
MCLLQKESWDEVFLTDDVNNSFKAFMNTFTYYFNTESAIKTSYVNNNNKNKWITKGLIVSRNRM